MDNGLNINRNISIQQMQDQLRNSRKNPQNSSVIGSSFEEILAKQKSALGQVSSLKFSKHANQRLEDRDIDMTSEQMERLEKGVSRANAKGINESLIMVDDLAFIVNVKNNTVVTAVTGDDDKVFSNIDGAVIA